MNWWIWRYGGKSTWWLKLIMALIGVFVMLPIGIALFIILWALWWPLGLIYTAVVADILLTLVS